jgi:nicotinamidase-related amidase/glutathione S-transferase/alkylated DNA repair dioxygenase AlkB
MFEIAARDFPVVRTRQALLVLDLQNDLVSTGGILPVDKPADFLDKIVELVPQFRRVGNVIWIKTEFESHRLYNEGGEDGERVITDAELPSAGKGGTAKRQRLPSKNLVELYNRMLANNTREGEGSGAQEDDDEDEDEPEEPYENETYLTLEVGKKPRCLVPLSLGANYTQVVAQSVDLSKDIFFTKTHYSAFATGALLQTLRGQFVTELFICGALTNISVFATAMDAARFGYSITLIEDCLGYRNQARHDEAIRQLVETTGCEMISSSELLEAIQERESAEARPSNTKRPPRGANDQGNLAKMMTKLHLRNEHNKRIPMDAGPSDPLSKSISKDASPSKAELSSPPESFQTGPSASYESVPEKPVPSKKSESDSKKRIPAKIKTRRRLSKSSSQDTEQQRPDLHKAGSSESHKTAKAPLLSPTQTTLASASEALKKIPSPPDTEENPSATAWKKGKPVRRDISKSGASTSMEQDKNDDFAVDAQANTEDEDLVICEGDSRVIHNLLPDAEADSIFERVRDEVRWQRMSHKGGEVPRLVAVQGEISDDGSIPVYRHPSDESPQLLPFTPNVSLIKSEVEKKLGHKVNHCLIQFYRSGTDYISEHSDKTLDIVSDSYIANVSFGALRVMTFRTKKPIKIPNANQKEDNTPRESQKAPLPHNSLCQFGLQSNMKWLHAIRQDKRREAEKSEAELAYNGGRISLTFRLIGTFLDKDQIKIWGQGAVAKEKEEARSVLNGETPEAEKMLWAFGMENHSSEFDWQETYGQGFDVLHHSNSRKLFLSGDPISDLRVKLMLTEYGLSWVVAELSPMFNWKGGKSDADAPEIPESFPVKIVDDDLARAQVQGDIAILLYLNASYGPAPDTKSQLQKAREYTRLMELDSLLQKWRIQPFSVKPFRRALAVWDAYASEDLYIAGSRPSVADFAFWPLLHEIVGEWGEGIDSPHLQSYYDRMMKRKSVQKVLGLLEG